MSFLIIRILKENEFPGKFSFHFLKDFFRTWNGRANSYFFKKITSVYTYLYVSSCISKNCINQFTEVSSSVGRQLHGDPLSSFLLLCPCVRPCRNYFFFPVPGRFCLLFVFLFSRGVLFRKGSRGNAHISMLLETFVWSVVKASNFSGTSDPFKNVIIAY